MAHRIEVSPGTLALVVLLILLARDAAPAGAPPSVIRTQAIEIVDSSGQRRITLDAFGGKPAIWLYDQHGRRRIGVAIAAGDVPGVILADPTGLARVELHAGAERAGELRLTDAQGRARIRLSVDYRDDPGLWMYDRLARARIGLKVNAGDPHLWLFEDPSGRVSFAAP